MAIKVENTTDGKIIGIGDVTILPGETKVIPTAFEKSPILEIYKKAGQIKVTGKPSCDEVTIEEIAVEKAVEATAEAINEEATEAVLTDEEAAQKAMELGINPADCKTQEDVKKKVKAATKKG